MSPRTPAPTMTYLADFGSGCRLLGDRTYLGEHFGGTLPDQRRSPIESLLMIEGDMWSRLR
jgi:hypothetical protein